MPNLRSPGPSAWDGAPSRPVPRWKMLFQQPIVTSVHTESVFLDLSDAVNIQGSSELSRRQTVKVLGTICSAKNCSWA